MMRLFTLTFVSVVAFFSFAPAQTTSVDSGDHLLHVIRAVADSGRADDLSEVSAIMHLSFSRINQTKPDYNCQQSISNQYAETGDNWFPPPTNKLHTYHVSGRDYFNGGYALAFGYFVGAQPDANGKGNGGTIFSHPTVEYTITAVAGCANPTQNGTRATILVDEIPGYACISEAQIKAFFPSAKPPNPLPPGSTAPMGSPSYIYQTSSVMVIFDIDPVPIEGKDSSAWPTCLIAVRFMANYPLGQLHKPDFSN